MSEARPVRVTEAHIEDLEHVLATSPAPRWFELDDKLADESKVRGDLIAWGLVEVYGGSAYQGQAGRADERPCHRITDGGRFALLAVARVTCSRCGGSGAQP